MTPTPESVGALRVVALRRGARAGNVEEQRKTMRDAADPAMPMSSGGFAAAAGTPKTGAATKAIRALGCVTTRSSINETDPMVMTIR